MRKAPSTSSPNQPCSPCELASITQWLYRTCYQALRRRYLPSSLNPGSTSMRKMCRVRHIATLYTTSFPHPSTTAGHADLCFLFFRAPHKLSEQVSIPGRCSPSDMTNGPPSPLWCAVTIPLSDTHLSSVETTSTPPPSFLKSSPPRSRH